MIKDPHIAIIVNLQPESPNGGNEAARFFGLNLSVTFVEDEVEKLKNLFKPWLRKPQGAAAAVFYWNDIKQISVWKANGAPVKLADADVIQPNIETAAGWEKYLIGVEATVDSFDKKEELIWNPKTTPDDSDDNTRRVRDYLAQLSNSAHPIGYYLNLCRHFKVKVKADDKILALPIVEGFGEIKVPPDAPADTPWKVFQYGDDQIYAYVIESDAVRPKFDEGSASLINLNNLWVRQREKVKEDQVVDIPYYDEDWTHELASRATETFDLAAALIRFGRRNPKLKDEDKPVSEIVDILSFRDAALTLMADGMHSGIEKSIGGLSVLEVWLNSLALDKPEDAEPLIKTIKDWTNNLKTPDKWLEGVAQTLPTVDELTAIKYVKLTEDEDNTTPIKNPANLGKYSWQEFLDQLDRLHSEIRVEENIAKILVTFWELASRESPEAKAFWEKHKKNAISDLLNQGALYERLAQNRLTPFWKELLRDADQSNLQENVEKSFESYIDDRCTNIDSDKKNWRPEWGTVGPEGEQKPWLSDILEAFKNDSKEFAGKYATTKLLPQGFDASSANGADDSLAMAPERLSGREFPPEPHGLAVRVDRLSGFNEDATFKKEGEEEGEGEKVAEDFLRKIAGFGMFCRVSPEAKPLFDQPDDTTNWRCLNLVRLCIQDGDKSPALFDKPVLIPSRLGYVDDRREVMLVYHNQPLPISHEAGELSQVKGDSKAIGENTERQYKLQYKLVKPKEPSKPFDDWGRLPRLLYGRDFDVHPFVVSNSQFLPKEVTKGNPAELKDDNSEIKPGWDLAVRENPLPYRRLVAIGKPQVLSEELAKLQDPCDKTSGVTPKIESLRDLLPRIPDETSPIARELESFALTGSARPQEVETPERRSPISDRVYRVSIQEPESQDEWTLVWHDVNVAVAFGKVSFTIDFTFQLEKTEIISIDLTYSDNTLTVKSEHWEEPIAHGGRKQFTLALKWKKDDEVVVFSIPELKFDKQFDKPKIPKQKGINVVCGLSANSGLLGALTASSLSASHADISITAINEINRDPPPLLVTTPKSGPWLKNRSEFKFRVMKPTVDIENWLRWWPEGDDGKAASVSDVIKLQTDVWFDVIKRRDEESQKVIEKESIPLKERSKSVWDTAQISPDDPAVADMFVLQMIPLFGVHNTQTPESLMKAVKVVSNRKWEGANVCYERSKPLAITVEQLDPEKDPPPPTRIEVPKDGVANVHVFPGEIWELRVWSVVETRWFEGFTELGEVEQERPARIDRRLEQLAASYKEGDKKYRLFSPLTMRIEAALDVTEEFAVLIHNANSKTLDSGIECILESLGYEVKKFTTTSDCLSMICRHAAVAVIAPSVSGDIADLASALEALSTPVVLWNSRREFYADNGLFPATRLEEKELRELWLSNHDPLAALDPSEPITVSITASPLVDATEGLLFADKDRRMESLLSLRMPNEMSQNSPLGPRMAILLSAEAVDGSNQLKRIVAAAISKATGPRLREALWKATHPRNEWRGETDPANPKVQFIRDQIAVQFDPSTAHKLIYISHVELMRQTWRWDGVPLDTFPFPSVDRSEIDYIPLLEEQAKPDAGMCAAFWDAQGFGRRGDDDHMRARVFVPLRLNPPAYAPLPTIFAEPLVSDNRARYDRFSAIGISRYQGLVAKTRTLALRNLNVTHDKPWSEADRWRRLFTLSRWNKSVPRPSVKFVLPLTENREVTDECRKPKYQSPPFLVMLDETWYSEVGLAESLSVDVEVKPIVEGESIEMFGEVGPDPILDATDVSIPATVLFDVEGPVGSTFDTSSNEPLYGDSWFVVHPRMIRNGDPMKHLDWHFYKVRLRRTLPGESLLKPPDQSNPHADGADAERKAWRVSLNEAIADLSSPQELKFFAWKGHADRPACKVSIKAVNASNSKKVESIGFKASALGGQFQFAGIDEDLPWRLRFDPQFEIEIRIRRDFSGDPKLAEKSIGSANQIKVLWRVSVLVRCDSASWKTIAEMSWLDAEQLESPDPVIMLGPHSLQAELDPLLESLPTDGAWIQTLTDATRYFAKEEKDSVATSELLVRLQYAPASDSSTHLVALGLFLKRDPDAAFEIDPSYRSESNDPILDSDKSRFGVWLALTELIHDVRGKAGHEKFITVAQQDDGNPHLFRPMNLLKRDEAAPVEVHRDAQYRARIIVFQYRHSDDAKLATHWTSLFSGISSDQENDQDEVTRIVSVSPPVSVRKDALSQLATR